MFIKNYSHLAKTKQRRIVLDILEAGLESIQLEKVIEKSVIPTAFNFVIEDRVYAFDALDHIYLLGFGKGSAKACKLIEELLGDHLTAGWVIDITPETFAKLHFTQGTHPLPSQTNLDFTKKTIDQLNNLTMKDLVLVVICGGGSAMLTWPDKIPLDQKIAVNKALLQSGATISEMNVVRKHFSKVKGGGLAKLLYPARVSTLIFSDVPGNDLSVIASGPTVPDSTTVDDAWKIIRKYELDLKLKLELKLLSETPKDSSLFEHVTNQLVLSNNTALLGMKKKAEDLGLETIILTDRLQGEAREIGNSLLSQVPHPPAGGSPMVLLAAGESTVTVTNPNGKGGRNQELVLGTLISLNSFLLPITILSFDSDGWDNSEFGGAIGDINTINMAQTLGLDPPTFLTKNDSYHFFEAVWDGIETGHLPVNVADLIIIYKE